MIRAEYLWSISFILVLISVEDLCTHIIRNQSVQVLFVFVLTGHLLDTVLADCQIWPVTFGTGLRTCAAALTIGSAGSLLLCRVFGILPFGGGDIKLLSAGALALGGGRTVVAFCCAVLTSSPVILRYGIRYLYKTETRHDHAFPFGPFICIGFCVSYIWGGQIIHWYLR